MSKKLSEELRHPPGDRVGNAIATVSTLVPKLGGALSNVLSGKLTQRKFDRVVETLMAVAEEVRDFEQTVIDEYISSDEFEDLLDETLRRVARERSKEKRALYRDFLRSAVRFSEKEAYDEQVEVVRILEQVTPGGMTILKALAEPPPPPSGNRFGGSAMETLRKRTGLDRDAIVQLTEQTDRIGLTNATAILHGMMTASGAEDLRGAIKPLGLGLLRHLQ